MQPDTPLFSRDAPSIAANCRKRPRMRANRGPSDARARSWSTMFDRRAGAQVNSREAPGTHPPDP